MKYNAENYDVAVIGAGHAGIEAGLASARLGCKTAVFTVNLDWVGNMPCNPSIGGTSKGHLVREIDALGGEMGVAADKNTLQSRMLNLGKGPAVHSPRAQVDRRAYSDYMKGVLERTPNLYLRQAEIVDITRDGSEWCCVPALRLSIEPRPSSSPRAPFSRAGSISATFHTRAAPTGCFPQPSLPLRSSASVCPPAASKRALRPA